MSDEESPIEIYDVVSLGNSRGHIDLSKGGIYIDKDVSLRFVSPPGSNSKACIGDETDITFTKEKEKLTQEKDLPEDGSSPDIVAQAFRIANSEDQHSSSAATCKDHRGPLFVNSENQPGSSKASSSTVKFFERKRKYGKNYDELPEGEDPKKLLKAKRASENREKKRKLAKLGEMVLKEGKEQSSHLSKPIFDVQPSCSYMKQDEEIACSNQSQNDAKLRQEIASLKQVNATLKLELENAFLKQENDSLKQEIVSCKQNIASFKREKSSLEQKNAILRQKNALLRQEGPSPEQENAFLRQEGASPEQENAFLRQEGASLEQENAFLLQEGASPEQENAFLKKENASFKQEIASLKKENASFKQEIASLKKENASFKQEIASLKKENASFKQEIASLLQEKKKYDNVVEDLFL